MINQSQTVERATAPNSSEDEHLIIQRILEGEVDAFEVLVNRNRDQVFGIVTRHVELQDIEDVAQNVFLKAYDSLASYREEAPFQHWLSRIAIRTCQDYWRARSRIKEVGVGEEELRVVDALASFDNFTEHEAAQGAREVTRWAFARLSADDRMLVSLRYVDGRSEQEAASLLGWSISQVKSRGFRARKYLQREFEKLLRRNET